MANGAVYYGDKGELTEVVGNLLDNAYKWCRSRVSVLIEPLAGSASTRLGFTLVVEDDGPGIDVRDIDRVVNRGVRADEHVDGHGIGLAVVREIAEINRGSLVIERSQLGGARMEVRIPPP